MREVECPARRPQPVSGFGNFAFFAPWQKLVMLLLMGLGRLEFFAVLALLGHL